MKTIRDMIDRCICCLVYQRYFNDCMKPHLNWYRTHHPYGPYYHPTKDEIAGWFGKHRSWIYRHEKRFGVELGYKDFMLYQDFKYFISMYATMGIGPEVGMELVGIELYNLGWRREEEIVKEKKDELV